MTDEARRPRIVDKTDETTTEDTPEDPIASDVYMDYFAFPTPERLEHLKKSIGEREKALFDCDLTIAQLDDAPVKGRHWEKTELREGQQCACGVCELERTRELRARLLYGVRKLRALYMGMA